MGDVLDCIEAFKWTSGWRKLPSADAGVVLSFPLKPEAVLRNPRKRLVDLHPTDASPGMRSIDLIGGNKWP